MFRALFNSTKRRDDSTEVVRVLKWESLARVKEMIRKHYRFNDIFRQQLISAGIDSTCFFCGRDLLDRDNIVAAIGAKSRPDSRREQVFFHEECLKKWERKIGELS